MKTNAANIDQTLDHDPPLPDNYVRLWHLVRVKSELGHRGSWKERLALWMAALIAGAMARDPEIRKMFCLCLATELRRMNAWLEEAAPKPPPSSND